MEGILLQHSSAGMHATVRRTKPCVWTSVAARAATGALSFCREDIFKEIDILVGMNHENVIFLKEYFEEGDKVGPHMRLHRVQVQRHLPGGGL